MDDQGFGRVRRLGLSLPGATEQIQWEDHLLLKVGGKMFVILDASGGSPGPRRNVLSLKCSDDDFDRLTALPGMKPAPHLQRHKWVALESYDALPAGELDELVERSYELVRAKLPAKVRASLATMPRSRTVPSEEDEVPSMADLLREEAAAARKAAAESRARPKRVPKSR